MPQLQNCDHTWKTTNFSVVVHSNRLPSPMFLPLFSFCYPIYWTKAPLSPARKNTKRSNTRRYSTSMSSSNQLPLAVNPGSFTTSVNAAPQIGHKLVSAASKRSRGKEIQSHFSSWSPAELKCVLLDEGLDVKRVIGRRDLLTLMDICYGSSNVKLPGKPEREVGYVDSSGVEHLRLKKKSMNRRSADKVRFVSFLLL